MIQKGYRMKKVSRISLLIFALATVHQATFAMEQSIQPIFEKINIKDLNDFDYKAASVLIRYDDMVVLGRESKGRSKGLYADFGGFKSRTEPETPLTTAARELCEETAGFLGTESELQKHIDPQHGNTCNVVASIPLKHAMFMTWFKKEDVIHFISEFFKRQHEVTEKEKKEKDTIAIISWKEFAGKIKNAPRDEKGFVKDVVMQAAETFDQHEKKTNSDIIVRAGLIAVLFPFFNDTDASNKLLYYELKSKL